MLVNNTILLCFFYNFLIIELYFLIPVVIAQSFNPTTKLVFHIEIPIKEVKAKIEIHPVIIEAKNIIACCSRFQVKLICCIAFGSTSSACCLLKSIAIILYNTRKNIFACLFSVRNTISLSRHDVIDLLYYFIIIFDYYNLYYKSILSCSVATFRILSYVFKLLFPG